MASLRSLYLLDTKYEERYDRITRIARTVFDVDASAISLVDTNRQWFKSRQGLDVCQTSRDVSFCGHVINADEVVVVNDARDDIRFRDNPLVTGDPYIRFYAGYPLRGPDDYKIGTLCVLHSEPRTFSDTESRTLVDLASIVEDEIKNSTRIIQDELTGLANRRGFLTVATRLLSLCRRVDSPIEMLYFDIDNLKSINDLHGHCAGDRVIQHFSELLAETFREADVVARIGGDEFVVLLTASSMSSDNALSRLHALSEDRSDDLPQRVLWSVGKVQFDATRHDTVERLLEDADALMYTNKHRHRVAAPQPVPHNKH